MRVCVIGTGYVGLVTGVCLAKIGHEVICIDNNVAKVEQLQAGRSPIYEPGLEALMLEAIATDRLHFSTDLAVGVRHGEILFIAVGTPALPNGESDTRYVEAVARGIGAHLNGGYKVVVNKSTVPIGSGDWVRRIILDGVADRQDKIAGFDVVSNPEFLREGAAVHDTFNPDRIVLGSSSAQAIALMQELYAPLILRQFADPLANPLANPLAADLPPVPVVVTDLASAEMIKYAANAFLATKISFINEVANICDRVGADVTQVAQGMGLDSRIGQKFLQAGIGWGGSCFPKDVAALIHTAQDYGYETKLLNAAVEVNRQQKLVVLEKLQQTLKVLKGKTIGILGLTFKPDTDDLRDAPALELIGQLQRLGAKVKAFDPMVSQQPHLSQQLNRDLNNEGNNERNSGTIAIVDNAIALAAGCDALVLMTDWAEFGHLNYADLAAVMYTPVMIDGRNQLDPRQLSDAGFYYVGIGRPWVSQVFPMQLLRSALELAPPRPANELQAS
jgi:UDPglucose 6-dehydrogenase